MNKYRNYSDEESLYTQDYVDHVQAMTAEKLHSKSDIAVELAGRDREVRKLKQTLNDITNTLYGKNLGVTGWHQNGNEEPMDDFFEDCGWIGEIK